MGLPSPHRDFYQEELDAKLMKTALDLKLLEDKEFFEYTDDELIRAMSSLKEVPRPGARSQALTPTTHYINSELAFEIANRFSNSKMMQTLQETAHEAVFNFNVGDKVKKVKGYELSGEVVACLNTLAGKPRYVVECTVPGAGGMLHIYNETVLDYNRA